MKIEFFEIQQEPDFEKEMWRLLIKKRFRRLPKQIQELSEKLEQGEFKGDRITRSNFPTPHDIYKLRLPNPDTNVGASNGYRVIYMVVTEHKIVVLLTMYYKKEQEDVSDEYIQGLIDGYFMLSLPEED